jgi:hypothetical protein
LRTIVVLTEGPSEKNFNAISRLALISGMYKQRKHDTVPMVMMQLSNGITAVPLVVDGYLGRVRYAP